MYSQKIAEVLEGYWPKNKAKGLLAQTILFDEVEKGIFGDDATEKLFPGCWLISPKAVDFYKGRHAFYVCPRLVQRPQNDSLHEILGQRLRPLYAIADYFDSAGIGFVFTAASTANENVLLEQIEQREFGALNWLLYQYRSKEFKKIDALEFFERWPGERGRPTFNNRKDWEENIKASIHSLTAPVLTELLLHELFMTGLLKSVLHKPLVDPYDVDAFLISTSQKYVFPMEIKEKFAGTSGNEKFFGIDAGRVAMLLRLCLPNDSNSIYLIRELDESSNFVGWKYITLSDIIMTSGWNLQAGGRGMGGQSTQTIKLPYDYFKPFNAETVSEMNLSRIGSLPKDIKNLVVSFKKSMGELYG